MSNYDQTDAAALAVVRSLFGHSRKERYTTRHVSH